jgi:hypothetical protein
MKFRSLPLSAAFGLSLTLALGVHAQPANAKKFTKLVQTGQIVPGNDQPVEAIIEPTIGFDGQVAVLLTTKGISNPPPGDDSGAGFGSDRRYSGIYSIPKNGPLRLVEGGESSSDGGGSDRLTYSAPAISQEQIAYLQIKQSSNRNFTTPRMTALRVGPVGNIRTALQFDLSIQKQSINGEPNLTFVNGKAVFVDDLGLPSGTPQFGVLGQIDTRSAKPALKILSSDPNNREIRASSQLLISGTGSSADLTTNLSQSFGDGRFQPLTASARSCGFSTSTDNVVACGNQIVAGRAVSNVSVRFGKAGKFINIPNTGGNSFLIDSHPSISNRSVIFKQSSPGPKGLVIDQIYLSQDGKAPISLVKTLDRIDGKGVFKLSLSRNGRTIADNAAVFTATFTDGTTALYRVDW